MCVCKKESELKLVNQMYDPFQPTLSDYGLKILDISLKYSLPCEALQNIVHSYLEIEVDKPTPYPILPDGSQAIFISSDGAIIGGAQSQASDMQILLAGKYFGIRFYPGTIRYFFNLNLMEITDQYVDSKYFPCNNFSQLHYKIYECTKFEGRAKICEQWLLKLFRPIEINSFDYALSFIYNSFGNIKVRELAESVGWSTRHLNRLFRYHTGLSTKLFTQVIRIQRVYIRLSVTAGDSLTTAHELGFFDQAHLLNEYRKRLLSNHDSFFDRFKSDFYNSKM